MRGPSDKVLVNAIDIYANISGPDVEGGPTFNYSGIPTYTQVACTVQFEYVREIVETTQEGQQRVTQENSYLVMFGDPPQVGPRDRINWVDNYGNLRLLYVEASADEAGRGAAFTFRAIERQ